MSETDARMCFERHATSKIRKANDLFAIQTMGFRGEAMASIAAIATVELKTKQSNVELGTLIRISGSKVETQEPISCQNGTNLSIKNLFFNVPARRKFLKSTSTELKHIMDEFVRVALANSNVHLILKHNDMELYNLPTSKIYNRIINISGRTASQNLIPVQSETSMAKIRGYVGKPENAKKTAGDQFFFVNNRFMKHPYFYKAVLKAYENILPHGLQPSFFIYFDIDPEAIDINIHPTKTEIKFENERALWPIVQATVREGLGKNNIVPSLDFNQEQAFDIPVMRKDTMVEPPKIKINPGYNPFENPSDSSGAPSADSNVSSKSRSNFKSKLDSDNWQQLHSGFEEKSIEQTEIEQEKLIPDEQIPIPMEAKSEGSRFFQIKGKYIMTAVKSGIMLINQRRAHERIIFDEYIYKTGTQAGIGQKLLYPQSVELSAIEAELLKNVLGEINRLGFEIDELGGRSFVINSIPAEFPDSDVSKWISEILDSIKENQKDFADALRDNLVRSLAKFLSIPYGKYLSQQEMAHLNDKLFISATPNLTPDGKTILTMMSMEEIEQKFK